jgi:hypothetical protein
VEVQFHAFLTLALYGVEWPTSCADCFTLSEGAPGTNWREDGLAQNWSGQQREKNPSLPLPGIEIISQHKA